MKTFFRLPRLRGAAMPTPTETKASGGGFIAFSHEGRAAWTGRSYAALAREGFMRNPAAHRAVRLIAEAAAAVPLLLYEGEEERSDHPLLARLARPNARMGASDFFETLYGHLLLAGNAYIEAVSVTGTRADGGVPRELHLLRPDRIRILEGGDGWPETYEYRVGEYRVGGAVRRYGAAEGRLLHLRLFHPLDDHLGFPPLAAAQTALDLSNAAASWNKALLDNSARPSGALVYQPKEGGNLSADQYERLKNELENGYSGPARAGRPLLLEGGLDWKAMGLSPKDMDFVEAKNGAARDIALAFGVPPMLLGIPGDNTYANYQEANRAFYRLTVLPMIGRVCAALSVWFGDSSGEALKLLPDLDQISALAGERSEVWTRVKDADFLSDDEKRQAVGY